MLSDKSADPYQSASMIQTPCFRFDFGKRLNHKPATKSLAITAEDELDPDVMDSMTSLGCFKDRQVLIDALIR